MYKYLLSLVFICLFLVPRVDAQLLEFSENPDKFVSQMDNLMNETKRQDCKETFERFKSAMKGGLIEDVEFTRIREIANKMLTMKMRATPHFNSYLGAIASISETGYNEAYLESWMKQVEEVLVNLERGKYAPYVNYLDFSSDFFSQGKLRSSSGGTNWIVDTRKFRFDYIDGEPVVKIPETTLIGKRSDKDSLIIQETAGVYYPLKFTWKGTKGKADWSRTILGEEVYCSFGPYTLDTKKTNYVVDSVNFNHPEYFKGAITGKFEDKIIISGNASMVSYPRFESFDVQTLNNIAENVEYVGGFRLHGNNVIGFANEQMPATIYVSNSGKRILRAQAESFVIREAERVLANEADVSLYFGKDSIYHPSIDFKYLIPEKILSLKKGEYGSSKAPFKSSFHMVEMDSDDIEWPLDSSFIRLGKTQKEVGRKKTKISLESLHYFKEEKYLKYQNIATFNPISTIKVFSEEQGTRDLHAYEVAQRLNPKYDISTITSLIYQLMEGGFIYYDKETEHMLVSDKVFHYADASVEKVDYDIINIVSSTKETNAKLDLSTADINVDGVDNIIISDSQLVVVDPREDKVVLKKNRNMDIAGRVFAGYCIFYGKEFHFDYDLFSMEMDSVDYFDIRIPTGEEDMDGVPLLLPLATRLEKLTGGLLIDAPGNKSGKEDIPMFPSFESREKSYAYYDDKYTQKGKYNRDSFYFELEPFVFDSLDGFDPESLGFEGLFVSSGIFPDIKERISPQNDFSLGFVHKTPPGGYDLYQGKANFKRDISLSNKGLMGDGQIDYLTSSFESDKITLLPNQALATTKEFAIKEKRTPVEYPEVKGTNVNIDWKPYEDNMNLKSAEGKPFEIFDGSYKMSGEMSLTPDNLHGKGELNWDEANMASEDLRFAANGVESDTANMSIKSLDPNTPAFNTKNVYAKLDFDNQSGEFKANTDEITSEMPYNQYKTSMDQFVWDMKEEDINFSSSESKDVYFLSTKKEQQGLIFSGTEAHYDLGTNLLHIEGVPHIVSGDAFIYPPDGIVEVEKDAYMRPFDGARIEADTNSRYHVITDASVTVEGKTSYKASGSYKYNIAGQDQTILFNDIKVVKEKGGNYVTKGSGTISESVDFFVDKKTIFKGTANLRADAKNLEFRGYAKFKTSKLKGNDWFSIKSNIDRKNVEIAYENPKNPGGQILQVGYNLSKDSLHTYPLIMRAPMYRKDRQIFAAEGIIKYDEKADTYYFGDTAKVKGESSRGNLFTYSDRTGKINMEGKFLFGEYIKYIDFDCAGTASGSYDDQKAKMDLIGGLRWIVPEKIMQVVAGDLFNNSFELKDLEYDQDYITKAMAEFIPDDKKLTKAVANADFGVLSLPKEMEDYTAFFSHLPMKWYNDSQSFIAKGKIGIVTIGGVSLNKYVDAVIEIRMVRNAGKYIDEVSFYIDSPSQEYYFFNYKEGVLRMLSSSATFNNALGSVKKKEARHKMEDGRMYELGIADMTILNFFLARTKNAKN